MDKIKQKNEKYSIPKLIFRAIIYLVFMFALIFISAGRINYLQGWLFYLNYVFIVVLSFYLFKDKKEFIKERMNPGKGIKWWDRVFFVFLIPLYLLVLVIGSLDSGRFYWTDNFPFWLSISGIILFNIFNAFIYWAMYVNTFFSSVVRIQKDRNQIVIKDGPYSIIRHPGYTGIIGLMFAIPLVLGSVYAIIPTVFVVILFIIRTYLEDKTLQQELVGYPEYMQEVQYRLIPKIW